MSAHNFRVIAVDLTGVTSVHPASVKHLSRKDAQRLANDLLMTGQPTVIKAHVVEIVMTLNTED